MRFVLRVLINGVAIWLATQLLAFGVPPSEFELWKDSNGNVEHGYGTPYLSDYVEHYQSTSSAYFQNASQPLALITG